MVCANIATVPSLERISVHLVSCLVLFDFPPSALPALGFGLLATGWCGRWDIILAYCPCPIGHGGLWGLFQLTSCVW